jgi:hypothetical protein
MMLTSFIASGYPQIDAGVPKYLDKEFRKVERAVSSIVSALGNLQNFADDTAAAAGGIAIGEFYRTGSALKVRVT